ncbi:unnamed protein product, partial [Closterium sp. Naga37s-1]
YALSTSFPFFMHCTPELVPQANTQLLSPCLQDLHSRRGLDGMLARRRKLLKYLRRKNWDSYCHVIAELGLRDRVDLQS